MAIRPPPSKTEKMGKRVSAPSTPSTTRKTGQEEFGGYSSNDGAKTPDSSVNTDIRSEQLHVFNEQQGVQVLGLTSDGQSQLEWPTVPQVDRYAATYSLREADERPSNARPTPAGQADSDRLDESLKQYFNLNCPSDDHPLQRFLSPGSPQDPTIYSKPALDELGTPYADGSSDGDRRKIAQCNYDDVMRSRCKHKSSARFDPPTQED